MKVYIGAPISLLPRYLAGLVEQLNRWLSIPRVCIDPHDVTDANFCIAAIAAPLLRQLAQDTTGYPTALDPADCLPELDSLDNWKRLIRKMARAFELVLQNELHGQLEQQEIQEGLRLFAKYFLALWN